MATTAVAVPTKKEARNMASRLQGMAKRAKQTKSENIRRGVTAVTAAAIGHLESNGTLPVAMFGGKVPTKAAIGLIAAGVAMFSTGQTKKLADAVADTSLALYAYSAGRSGTLIAG